MDESDVGSERSGRRREAGVLASGIAIVAVVVVIVLTLTTKSSDRTAQPGHPTRPGTSGSLPAGHHPAN